MQNRVGWQYRVRIMNVETPAGGPQPGPGDDVASSGPPLLIDEDEVAVELALERHDEDSTVVDLVAFQRLRGEVARLKAELELWRRRAETAEALSAERGRRLQELRDAVEDLEGRVAEPEVRYTVVRVPVSKDRIVSLDEPVPDDLRTPPRGWLRRLLRH
jgi:hypothetical protein